ncbi:MAG: leucine-rich repeat protein, partial [Ruminococcus sp.]
MSGVKTITFKCENVPSAPCADIFYSMNSLEIIYVPVASYANYVAAYTPYMNNARILMDSDSDFVIDNGVLLQYSGSETNVVIPEGVKSIGESAFKNNTNIESVVFSDDIETVSASAFYNCTALKTVTLNHTLGIIGDYAFAGCKSLEGVKLDTIVKIGSYAFDGCTSLSGELSIPVTARTIGSYAFRNCSLISSVNIAGDNEGITIGSYAFYNCSGIKKVELGNTTTMGDYAFANCSGINAELKLNDTVTSIGNYAFAGCKNIPETLEIPDSVKSISSYAFQNCSAVKGINLPSNITSLSNGVFDGCSSIEDVVIPDSITSIGDSAFRNCSSVETITLGKNVASIGSYNSYSYAPFYGMTNVREFTLKGDKLPSAPYPDIFYSMNRLQTVYVTEKAYHSFSSVYSQYINNAKYRVEGYDGDFVINSENELLVYQGNDTTVAIPDEVETISVSAFQNNSTIEEVVLNENLTKIDSYAFENCVNLKNVKMNRNLESMGSRAFYNCTSLSEINFSEAITSIGSYAFFGCTGLDGELRIPETVKSIGNYAFSGDNSLEKVKIVGNSDGTSVGSYAFQNCKSMTSVDLGSVKTIGAYAFQNCSSLSSTLTIPDSVVSANEGAFAGCGKIEEVKISENLTAISSYLFDGCISLCGEIIVPDSVETIYDYAFRNCKNVTSVVLGSNVSNIGSNNYYGYSPFLGMTAVRQFMFRGSVVPKCAYPDIFYSMNSLETIYIPANTESDYVKAFDAYKNNAVFSSDTMRYEVKNLKISNIYSSTVKLEWSAHQSEKVVSYVVERNNEIVATVKNCQYIDYDLETGET